MKKMFVIFENLERVHLGKDVGALPLALQNNDKWDIKLLSTYGTFSDEEYEKSIELKFFTKYKNRFLNKLYLFIYVLLNVKSLNYLMVFHGGKDKYLLFWLCKLFNKKLVTYVKLDMGEMNAQSVIEKNEEENFIKRIVRKSLSTSVNLYTVETTRVFDMIKDIPQYENKLHYLPNGFYADKEYDFSTSKEKMIISVGRIGTPQKNNELLLSAISRLKDIGDYKFYFIGPVEESFKERVESLFNTREDLKDKIILTGNITDKEELYSYYKRAEILTFTSIYEGFSLVMIEGLYFGCYLLSTDLSGAYDLTENGKFGKIVKINDKLIEEFKRKKIKDIVQYTDDDFEKIVNSKWFEDASIRLSSELQNVIDGHERDISNISRQVAKHVYDNFNWKTIAVDLKQYLEEI